MSGFSASDAALEGFQVLRAHWRVTVGWALFTLLALVATVVVTVIVSVGVVLATGADAESGAAAALGALFGLLVVGLIYTVLVGGLYRLMLRPADPGFLHLRLGRDEARLFVVGVILVIGLSLVVVAFLALGALLRDIPGAHAVSLVLGLALAAWLLLRLGLVAPLCFVERRIDFARAWRMSRRHGWGLFGMWLLNFFLLLLVAVALSLAVFVISGLLTGFHGFASAQGSEAFENHPGRYLIEAILPILCLPALVVLRQAPWVAAYRSLADGGGAET